MKKISFCLAILSLFAVACGESGAIKAVKKSCFCFIPDMGGRPEFTIDEVVNASMRKPSWKLSGKDSNGDYVRVEGTTSNGRPFGMEFIISKNKAIAITSVDIDSKIINQWTLNNLLYDLYNNQLDVYNSKNKGGK